MKNRWVGIFAVLILAATAARAETTVTVQDDGQVAVKGEKGNVVVSNAPAAQPVVAVPAAPLVTQVVEEIPARDDRYELQGEIVKIDYPESALVIRDTTPREKRITGDPAIVSTLKVGDMVKVDLRRNDTRAHRIIEI